MTQKGSLRNHCTVIIPLILLCVATTVSSSDADGMPKTYPRDSVLTAVNYDSKTVTAILH